MSRLGRPGLSLLSLCGVAIVLAGACGSEGSTPTSPPRPVRLGESFALRVGDTVEVEGAELAMTFSEVVSDSRCPKDVTCVRAGEAFVHFMVESAGGEETALEFEVPPGGGDEESFEDLDIIIVELNPQIESGKKIEPSGYVATVRVERN